MDASCKNGSGTAYNSSSCSSISSPSCVDMEGYSYVMVEEDRLLSDVPDLCRIDYTLEYGFEVSWFPFCCYYGHQIENRCNLDDIKNCSLKYYQGSTDQPYYCTYSLSPYVSAYLKYCIMNMHTIFALFYVLRV
ncbi:hypothetical protein NC651_036161 [Populus alba x Populus x berolinensis]|nr:hypothetical protein NC651_036161 [Populus alba x Populus x berolinensis]